MLLKCFLINKSSPNHHSDDSDVPMFVCRKKKSDDEENDMVVEPMACDNGSIFDIFNVRN